MNEEPHRLPVKSPLGNCLWSENDFIWDIPFHDSITAVLFSQVFLSFIGNEFHVKYGITGIETGTDYIIVGVPDESGVIIKPNSILCEVIQIEAFPNHYKGLIKFNPAAIPDSSFEEFSNIVSEIFETVLSRTHIEALKI